MRMDCFRFVQSAIWKQTSWPSTKPLLQTPYGTNGRLPPITSHHGVCKRIEKPRVLTLASSRIAVANLFLRGTDLTTGTLPDGHALLNRLNIWATCILPAVKQAGIGYVEATISPFRAEDNDYAMRPGRQQGIETCSCFRFSNSANTTVGPDFYNRRHKLKISRILSKSIQPCLRQRCAHQMHVCCLMPAFGRKSCVNSDTASLGQQVSCVEVGPTVLLPPAKNCNG